MDEDDMIVLVIGNPESANSSSENPPSSPVIKPEPIDESDMMEIIEKAKKHGKLLDIMSQNDSKESIFKKDWEQFTNTTLDIEFIKQEHYSDEEFLEQNLGIKEELIGAEEDDKTYAPEEDLNDDDYTPDIEENDSFSDSDVEYESKVHRRAHLGPAQRKSFVQDLKQEYPELSKNEKALIRTIAEIMRNVKRPQPPRDYYIVNDIMFECRKCGTMSETEPAASRHYQEKHGPRYLVCYACGVDFRSTTNLYKHEKRCIAPDAVLVLKARALSLGRKGRGRPFLPKPDEILLRQPVSKKYCCAECPAVFSSKPNLEAHENLHKGLRPYRCSQCPNAYTSYPRLRRHMRQHSSDAYICDHCGRLFKVKEALVVHLNTHMPVAKFGCSECSRRYATKAALNHHVRRQHLRLPPACACPICPKRYPRMSLVRDHMKKTHGMSLMTRKMFFKALPTLTEAQLQKAKDILKLDQGITNLASNSLLDV
ncbi:unnamed protein product [Diatraea saccharalis]|uniref:C2H2-type domain-containing protein n=1 Tax=Diatraea saccharalis TaxID=40085 RepID=A0A9N9WDP5_9NEOP|nr:unnamed protein product [Diatraea saccharalis]